ncbi:MAG: ABC transporter substrate-binding protein [Sneathiellaceae bacterium]
MLRRSVLRGMLAGAGALALTGLTVTGLSTAGLGSEARAAEPITVGFSIAKSGYMSAYDLPALNGAMLKIQQINAGGGLLGRQIETVVLDMKTDAALSAKTGAELADMGVDLIVTDSDYDLGAPAALAAKEAGILAFATGAADPKMGVQGVGWQTFTGNGAAQLEGIVMAEFGFKEKGWKKAFVLEDQLLEYNKSGCAGFEAAWQDLGGTLADQDVFMNQDPSIASQIARIKGSDAEVIYLCSLPPGGASAVRQIRAAGIDLPILANVGMTGNFWLDAVPDLSNFWNPTPMSIFGDDPRAEVQAFAKAYEAAYGEPVPQAYAIFGYGVIEQWAKAVERAGTTDAKAVVAELEKFDKEPLVVGPTSYSADLHIQVQRPLLIEQITGGKHEALKLWTNGFVPDMPLLFRVGR